MNPLSGIQVEVMRWTSWMLDRLGWALAVWLAFFVLTVWAAWMLTRDNERDE